MGCDQVRDLAPELALGIAEGQERDAALRHVSGCTECRQLVSDLSSVGDELLLLVPDREPPRGFESRVLAKLAEPSTERRLQPLAPRRRLLAAVAAAAVALAATLGGGSVFLATAGDRRLADSYQAVPSQGQGAFFLAAPLEGAQGRVGTVFGYQVQVVTRDGSYLPLADEVILGEAERAWGGQLPVDLSAVRGLRFVGSDGQTVFTATFNANNPWD